MNGLEGLRTRPVLNQNSAQSLEGLRFRPIQKEEGDSWLSLIPKALGKGIGSIADLAKLGAQGIEGIGRGGAEAKRRELELMGYLGSDIETPEFDTLSSHVPDYQDIRKFVKRKTDVDIEPKPTTEAQRIASHAAEFAGSLGPWGMFGKGAGALKAAKLAGTGAGVGGISGALQEDGVDPLTADIGTSLAFPFGASAIKGAGNLYSKFTLAGNKKRLQKGAGDILRSKVGEKNIPDVLERLDAKAPLNANLNTAELAENTGLAQLHQAMGQNLSPVKEKEALTDAIIRNRLGELSSKTHLQPEQAGESIRNNLSQTLDLRKKNRSEITDPLYQKVNEITEGVDLPNTLAFLEKEGQFAKGDIKNNLNYVQDIIKANKAPKGKLSNMTLGGDRLAIGELSPETQARLQKEFLGRPVPAEITNALKDISGRIGAAKKAGNNEVARTLMQARENLLADMAYLPEEKLARSTYANLSKPISRIEKEPLLGKIVKKDTFGQDFLLSPEKIPDMILNGSLNNTRALVSEIGKDKKAMDVVRGQVARKLLNTSENASLNAFGEQTLSYNKVNNFLKKNNAKLKYIFDEDQVKVLEDARTILKKRNMAITMGRAFGSNTQSETTLLAALTQPVESFGTKALKRIPGGKYILPLYEAGQAYEKQQIIQLLEQALIDPKTAKLLLTPAKDIKSQNGLTSVLKQVGLPATAYSLINANREEK